MPLQTVPPLLPFAGHTPQDEGAAFLAPNATLLGQVTLGKGCSVWYGAVLRGDLGSIKIGAQTNVQDGAVLHTGAGHDLHIGQRVSIGHCAVVHGCTVGDDALIGMHATVLNGAVIGEGCVIGAGAVVPQGMQVPPHTVVLGVPGKVHGAVSPDLAATNAANVEDYCRLAAQHAALFGQRGGVTD